MLVVWILSVVIYVAGLYLWAHWIALLLILELPLAALCGPVWLASIAPARRLEAFVQEVSRRRAWAYEQARQRDEERRRLEPLLAKVQGWKAEGFHGAMVEKAELGAYFHFYNAQRPHQALGYRTPAEVFNQESDTSPQRAAERR